MRSIGFAVLVAVFGLTSGCAHKPAYSNINTDRPRAVENSNGGETTAPPPAPAPTPSPNPTEAEQAAATPDANKIKFPAFLDQATGGAKDLPNYPKSHRVNITFGPISGSDTMSLVLRTKDPMDAIATFYDNTIKKNGWTVTDKTRDPELSEWNVKKGDRDSGRVRVQRDPRTGLLDIIIVRTQAIQEPQK
jgi:hypothetical protein